MKRENNPVIFFFRQLVLTFCPTNALLPTEKLKLLMPVLKIVSINTLRGFLTFSRDDLQIRTGRVCAVVMISTACVAPTI